MNRSQKLLGFAIGLGIITFLAFCSPGSSDNSSYTTIATLHAYPTFISIFDYPGQVTDGKLLMSIEEYRARCRQPDEPFQIKFSFKNLTDEPIKFVSEFFVAANRRGDGGNLISFITNKKGEDVLGLGDFRLVDIFRLPPETYTELSGYESADFVVEFYFPTLTVEDPSKDVYNYVTHVPGKYFVRFVYSQYDPNPDVWQEAISSNTLEICIID